MPRGLFVLFYMRVSSGTLAAALAMPASFGVVGQGGCCVTGLVCVGFPHSAFVPRPLHRVGYGSRREHELCQSRVDTVSTLLIILDEDRMLDGIHSLGYSHCSGVISENCSCWGSEGTHTGGRRARSGHGEGGERGEKKSETGRVLNKVGADKICEVLMDEFGVVCGFESA